MATKEELIAQLQSALSRVDAASTKVGEGISAVAARIDALKQQLADAIANGVQVSELQPIVDALGVEAEQLEANAATLAPLGSDVANPVPVEPPPVG